MTVDAKQHYIVLLVRASSGERVDVCEFQEGMVELLATDGAGASRLGDDPVTQPGFYSAS
jgi:hypothetical protein